MNPNNPFDPRDVRDEQDPVKEIEHALVELEGWDEPSTQDVPRAEEDSYTIPHFGQSPARYTEARDILDQKGYVETLQLFADDEESMEPVRKAMALDLVVRGDFTTEDARAIILYYEQEVCWEGL